MLVFAGKQQCFGNVHSEVHCHLLSFHWQLKAIRNVSALAHEHHSEGSETMSGTYTIVGIPGLTPDLMTELQYIFLKTAQNQIWSFLNKPFNPGFLFFARVCWLRHVCFLHTLLKSPLVPCPTFCSRQSAILRTWTELWGCLSVKPGRLACHSPWMCWWMFYR